MDVRQKAWGTWRHHEHLPLSRGNRPQRGKGQDDREEERGCHDSQRATRIVECASSTKEDEDVACPRCDRELPVFNTASGPILRCRGWNLAGTPCTLINACQDGDVVPGGFSEWIWWPRNTLRTRQWRTGSTSYQRLDGPSASPGCRPSVGARTSGNFLINNVNTFNINSSSWRRRQQKVGECIPRTANPLGTSGVWIRERIGLVCNRPIQHNVRVRKRESSTGVVW